MQLGLINIKKSFHQLRRTIITLIVIIASIIAKFQIIKYKQSLITYVIKYLFKYIKIYWNIFKESSWKCETNHTCKVSKLTIKRAGSTKPRQQKEPDSRATKARRQPVTIRDLGNLKKRQRTFTPGSLSSRSFGPPCFFLPSFSRANPSNSIICKHP